ncbi:nucleoside triphosphate pyrophosphohydrolase family protein [Gallibacterium anatis]|uniref:nucleoside triphosphate pyrophosphohydrolase family protein n=1 Tax=Gallibacterium anatis TaxID=750 RepID=UPI0026700A9D|nr:nucleoside triphosphate pyrophosphohydrolase family protein [Gallibacterium anatis]WKS98361.1 nucleoside triphosphate pyrophosphohydrolase family protein [Gallibacterium anatis]
MKNKNIISVTKSDAQEKSLYEKMAEQKEELKKESLNSYGVSSEKGNKDKPEDTEVITKIKEWFEVAVPQPTEKNQAIQMGCHLEEVTEMINVFNPWLGNYIDLYAQSYKEWKTLDNIDWTDYKLIELLDALCDQIVTAIGVAHMFGFDIKNALAEVNKSNWSKFENGKPVFNKNGKIKKGKYYKEPELEMFINK